MKKQISVIVPVYNVERYLTDTVNSILAQTFEDFELWLIDDGSTDSTPEICDSFAKKDERIRVVHKANGGVSSARNEGLRRATGEYVCFIDGDDLVDPRMLEVLYKNALEHGVDISCCGIVQKTLDGIVNNAYCNGEKALITDKDYLIEQFFSSPIYREVLYGPVNKIIKSELAKSVCFNEKYKIAEDLLFSFECIERMGSFYFEDVGMYYYIKREGSATTSSFSKKRFDYIYVADILLAKCKEKYSNAYNSALYWTFVHKLNMCRALCINSGIKKENKSFYNECYSFCRQHKKELWSRLPIKKKAQYRIVSIAPFLCKIF